MYSLAFAHTKQHCRLLRVKSEFIKNRYAGTAKRDMDFIEQRVVWLIRTYPIIYVCCTPNNLLNILRETIDVWMEPASSKSIQTASAQTLGKAMWRAVKGSDVSEMCAVFWTTDILVSNKLARMSYEIKKIFSRDYLMNMNRAELTPPTLPCPTYTWSQLKIAQFNQKR